MFAGADKENPERTQTAEIQPDGWQYVLFDVPLEVGSSDLYIGYTVTSPYVTVERASSSNDEIYEENAWYDLGEVVSNEDLLGQPGVFAVQAIMTGGDYSERTQIDMVLEDVQSDKDWAILGEAVNIKALVRNNGVRALSNVKVTAIIGQQSESQYIAEELKIGQYKLVEFNGLKPESEGELEVTVVVSADDDENYENSEYYSAVRIYGASATPKNRILIEHVTGTWCMNCPAGATALKEAIAGLDNPDKVAWISYHNGDQFTTSAGDAVYSKFGITGVPSSTINRTARNVNGSYSFVWSPSFATTEILQSSMEEPALVTLSISNRVYNPDTRELSLTVSGKSMAQEAYLTAIVLQNGIIANQTSGGSNYEHNNIPWTFITSSAGTKLTTDAEGNYSVDLKKEVSDKLSSYDYDPDNMNVVVFVHGNLNSSDGPEAVYNADLISLK